MAYTDFRKKKTLKKKKKTIKHNKLPLILSDYKMGEVLGKGAFGIVYRALNLKNAHVVAIKSISLNNIPEEELNDVEMEIKFLKKLSHSNIVQYVDTIKTNTHLNVVLELVENGSLVRIMQEFGGCFPEPLVAIYISQILNGLKYLHSEGVIHRDIKASNILCTKEGVIKLADFGVATLHGAIEKAGSATGSPYWMAPEVIELSGKMNFACDIWSVGCTTIELVTGKPPYFDLAQMPAFFRIVQDEHPPFPANISPLLEDFLLNCFKKIPSERMDTSQLLKHEWILTNTKNMSKRKAWYKTLKKSSGIRMKNSGVSLSSAKTESALNFEKSYSSKSHSETQKLFSSCKDMEESDYFFGSSRNSQSEESLTQEKSGSKSLMSSFDKTKTTIKEMKNVFQTLWNSEDETDIVDSLQEINDFFNETELRKKLLELKTLNENTFRLLEVMQSKIETPEIVENGLQLVANFQEFCPSAFNELCGMGFLNVLCSITFNAETVEIKTIVLQIIKNICLGENKDHKSQFVSTGGVEVFKCFFTKDFEKNRDTMITVLNCLYRLLEENKSMRIHLCSILTINGMIEKLCFLLSFIINESESNFENLKKLSFIFLYFSKEKRNSLKVISHFANLRQIVKLLTLQDKEILTNAILCLKNMTKTPSLSENFEKSNILPAIIPLLSHKSTNIQNTTFKVIHEVIKIQSKLQELAASNQIIPELIKLIKRRSFLRNIAFSMLCKMVYAGHICREELRKNVIATLFLSKIKPDELGALALDSYAHLHYCEKEKNEIFLLDRTNFYKIFLFLKNCEFNMFENSIDSVFKLVAASPEFCKHCCNTEEFFRVISTRSENLASVKAKTSLLKAIKVMIDEYCVKGKMGKLVKDHLREMVERMSKDEKVIVSEFAKKLLDQSIDKFN